MAYVVTYQRRTKSGKKVTVRRRVAGNRPTPAGGGGRKAARSTKAAPTRQVGTSRFTKVQRPAPESNLNKLKKYVTGKPTNAQRLDRKQRAVAARRVPVPAGIATKYDAGKVTAVRSRTTPSKLTYKGSAAARRAKTFKTVADYKTAKGLKVNATQLYGMRAAGVIPDPNRGIVNAAKRKAASLSYTAKRKARDTAEIAKFLSPTTSQNQRAAKVIGTLPLTDRRPVRGATPKGYTDLFSVGKKGAVSSVRVKTTTLRKSKYGRAYLGRMEAPSSLAKDFTAARKKTGSVISSGAGATVRGVKRATPPTKRFAKRTGRAIEGFVRSALSDDKKPRKKKTSTSKAPPGRPGRERRTPTKKPSASKAPAGRPGRERRTPKKK